MPAGRPAVFLDRDGTILHDPGYLKDPGRVALLPEAGPAIAKLNAAGYAVVVVTNQSGIGRGFLTEEDFARVQSRMDQLLEPFGARIDATYVCPHAPEDGPCGCRKPGVELFQRAAAEHHLDFRSSWFVGDRLTDLLPALTLGGRGLLLLTGEGSTHSSAARTAGFDTAADLAAAVERIRSETGDVAR